MTKRYVTTLRAICIALVLSLALVGDLLQCPPQVLAPAFVTIFGAVILLQRILEHREAGQSDNGRTG
jgi:hypothetical protein